MSRCSLLFGVVAACAATEVPPAPIPPVSTGKVRVRVFTEPAPVRLLAPVGRFVFVGTDSELERWDADGGVLTLSADHGLSGSQVVALAADEGRRRVWVLTEGGLGYYDAGSEVYAEVPAPPAGLVDFAVLAKEGGVSLAPTEDGGVWVAGEHGLARVSGQGEWSVAPIKDSIRALASDRAGWLWAAARGGVLAVKPTGEVVRVGGVQGCAVVEPRLVVELAEGRMLVIGADAEGHDRVAIGRQLSWVTYRALPEVPEVRWDAAARRGAGAVVMGGERVYRIGPANAERVRPLSRDGMRLVAVAGSAATEWAIEPLDLTVPTGAVTVGAAGDQLLIGTRDLGTARYRDGDVQPRGWLRRKQMFQDATGLSVACARALDCWIATGARRAWHWMGERFVAGGPDQVVLAVVRDPAGPIYALHRASAENEIHLSRIEGTTWTQVSKVALTTPGTAPEVSFARFAVAGSLWVGLRYRDGVERRAYGLAIVETETGRTTYHRTEELVGGEKKSKMMPIPVGVVDGDVKGATAWFATNEGVARLAKGEVTLWSEADGLRSELARAVTIALNGDVIVATGAGAGVWNGVAWDFPAALRFEINDVVATRNGQVWMATERGIAAWDGKKVRRVDVLRGLAENEVIDVAADQFDRVWARGPGSLTLVSQ